MSFDWLLSGSSPWWLALSSAPPEMSEEREEEDDGGGVRRTPVGGAAQLFTFSVRKEASRQMVSVLNGMTAEVDGGAMGLRVYTDPICQ